MTLTAAWHSLACFITGSGIRSLLRGLSGWLWIVIHLPSLPDHERHEQQSDE
ncbi:hypothetical protein YPPY66_5021 [Yersinia pestis PY-66]|uniref:Uncharacterized protein n=1 Tax=Yersinia pestis TaxID=632 RepID=Q8CK74_YERPE|nr:hypothetical [Yersinia pestis KIM10+]EIQ83138.1 hypothetical protein YPPY02_4644 [Yersinia pestis PY-02]EIQ97615.1 hypothetical protein YPPY05_4629 [Yersinia pestis PY-05]EIR13383.1 hypothetical protein YPPY09_4697 [Yersinia pestis PY-09]EIR26716.1 hypothetical protein YPPY11_4790 [Yersinia pestis PY-11]EIR99212.1 hypothetical protein YPPY48_4694 [Yersinia pestis PY-48]EIS52994.1 hypothetical protein YPPY64_4622 [Yersinia pestis PY-64]EIS64962.1 hypothetical protein YPPY66_5021 [Yersinia 